MDADDRTRERRARRHREAGGETRQEPRPRHPLHIVNPAYNTIVARGSPWPYSMTLDAVESVVAEPASEESR
jgi:hypothetical protein